MATDYKINGVATSIAPFSVQWQRQQMGTDHNGAPLFSLDHTIVLQFDSASIPHAKEWLDQTSGGSINLTVLNKWQLGMTTLSSVYLTATAEPEIQDVNAGPFTITVLGARE